MLNEQQGLPTQVEEPFLPGKETKRKYTLILDLDETLIHSVIIY